MSISLLRSLASSGGRITLSAPSISPGSSAGQFIINNYDSTYIYTLSANISRSGNILTLSPTTATGTISQRSPKGLINSASRTIERQPITYTTTCTVVSSYQVSSCCCPDGWNFEDYGSVKYCRLYSCTSTENPVPSGWTKINGEWIRIT